MHFMLSQFNFYCTLLTKDQRTVQDMVERYFTYDAMSNTYIYIIYSQPDSRFQTVGYFVNTTLVWRPRNSRFMSQRPFFIYPFGNILFEAIRLLLCHVIMSLTHKRGFHIITYVKASSYTFEAKKQAVIMDRCKIL